jgi:hypothetical protein
VGLLDERRALRRLGPVGQQPDARALDAEDGVGQRGAHEGELDEVLRAHLDVRAHVDERHRVAGDRDRQRERRAVDAAGALDLEQAGGQRGAGRAGGDERVGLPGGDGARRLDHRGLTFGARCAGGVGRLGDRQRRVDDRDVPRDVADLRGGPEQRDAHATLGGAERDLAGAEVGPVGVDRDRRGHQET